MYLSVVLEMQVEILLAMSCSSLYDSSPQLVPDCCTRRIMKSVYVIKRDMKDQSCQLLCSAISEPSNKLAPSGSLNFK